MNGHGLISDFGIIVRGLVKSSLTGMPVSKFKVILLDDKGKQLKSLYINDEKAEGTFKLEYYGEKAQVYLLEIKKRGYYSSTKAIQVDDNEDDGEINLIFSLV